MINLDSLALKILIQEITPLVENGKIQKIQQSGRDELLLNIRIQGQSHKLFLCANPKYPHICILSKEGEEQRRLQMPSKAPMFCMLLRKHMEGAKIKKIITPPYERIVEIYFDSYSETGTVPLVLACELMGKHSNIVLYNYETNVILGCSHTIGENKSRERETAGGLTYVYPPKQIKTDILSVSEEKFIQLTANSFLPLSSWLNQTFYYISIPLAKEILQKTGIEEEESLTTDNTKALYNKITDVLSLQNVKPSINQEAKTYSIIDSDNKKNQRCNSVNEMIDFYYGSEIYMDAFTSLKRVLEKSIEKELKKQTKKFDENTKKLESEEKAEKYKQYADILTANLFRIKEQTNIITLENFYNDNKPVQIDLDISKTPSENAQKYYKLYNKLKTASSKAGEEIEKTKKETSYLESLKTFIKQAEINTDLSSLYQIKEEMTEQKLLKEQKRLQRADKKPDNIIKFNSPEGFEIFVGKNNKQNDYIISKLASQDDIWLHVHNMHGGHVIIKNPNKSQVPEKTMLQAANIAACLSEAKNSTKVPIIYTTRKFLKKPPCAKPGYVTYSNEKTIFINPDAKEIQNMIG